MKRQIVLVFIFLATILLSQGVEALAWSNTTFNNSLTEEDLVFTGNENITRWLEVPSAVNFLTDGFFNLTGFVPLAGIFTSSRKIISYWNLDEAAGTVLDSIGIHNGINNASTPNVAGLINTAYDFDTLDNIQVGQLGLTGPNMTINAWINPETTGATVDPIIGAAEVNGFGLYIRQNVGGNNFLTFSKSGVNEVVSTLNITPGAWIMVTLVYNDSGVNFFANGTFHDAQAYSSTFDSTVNSTIGRHTSSYFDGIIDELGVWNTSLTGTEVLSLYNSGAGFGFGAGNTINTTLTVGDDLFNITVEANGTIPRTATISGLANIVNRFLTPAFLVGSNYLIPFVFHSDKPGVLNYSSMLFENTGFIENSQTFNAETFEGNVETFIINISVDPVTAITNVSLNYNGTEFSPIITTPSSTNAILSATISIPSVNSQVNRSFFWSFDIEGTQFNSTINNQTVNNLAIDDCSSFGFLILNYTLRDEDTQAVVTVPNNASMRVDVNIFPVGSSTPIINFSQNYNETVQALVCLQSELGTSSLTMNSQVQYGLDGYSTEFHHIRAFNLTNSSAPQTIPLLDLLSTRAQNFVITVKDTNFLPLSDAIIDITRNYVADGIFRSVEVPLTDVSGQASVSLVQSSEIYTFIVSKDGEILATFDNVVAVCQNQITSECNIFLNIFSGSTVIDSFENFNGLNLAETFNRDTRTITVLFTTTDGSNALMSINTTKFDRFGNTTVCSDSLLSSSGSLTCTIPESFGNVSIQSQIFKDGSQITNNFYNLQDGATEFGPNGIIMALIMIITLALMFIGSPIGVIIGAMMGVILSGLLLLYTGGSLFGVTSTITWLIVAGGILILRMVRGGEA